MREDIRAFVAAVSQVFPMAEPLVEIGSYQVPGQEGLADLRSLFPAKQYVGCDIVSGAGVDRIEDLHRLSFADGSIGTLIAVETLEHVADPFLAVREIERALRPGGIAILTTPFNFPIHHMPDYTRFTPEGMARLLGGFRTQAVFAQGDAQHPHSVCGIALKGGSDADAVAFEALAARFQNAWNLGTAHDALVRFEPLFGVARCDRPERDLGALGGGRRVEQTLRCPQNGLVRIDLKFTLLGARSPGQLRLEVLDDGDASVAIVETPARYVWHARWVAFQFPPLAQSGGHRLRLRLTCSDPQTTVALLASTQETLPDCELVVDGMRQAGSLCFEAFCQRPSAASPQSANMAPVPQAAQPGATLAAARIQAAELRYATALLHADVEHLRSQVADVSARLDRVGAQVVDEFATTLRRYRPVRFILDLLGRTRSR
jgi:SAM-dependent methyltransferase